MFIFYRPWLCEYFGLGRWLKWAQDMDDDETQQLSVPRCDAEFPSAVAAKARLVNNQSILTIYIYTEDSNY